MSMEKLYSFDMYNYDFSRVSAEAAVTTTSLYFKTSFSSILGMILGQVRELKIILKNR